MPCARWRPASPSYRRRLGELASQVPREQGGNPRTGTRRTAAGSFRDELGVSEDTVRRWQVMAAVDESRFREWCEGVVVTYGELLDHQRVACAAKTRQNQV